MFNISATAELLNCLVQELIVKVKRSEFLVVLVLSKEDECNQWFLSLPKHYIRVGD